MTDDATLAPDWFRQALAQPGHESSTLISGVRIRFRAWGPAGAPGVLLVHGGAAHAGWWDHIAPSLVDGIHENEAHRVIALDLSGHGDSDRRPEYHFETWADELAAVVQAAQAGAPTVVVGHSLGGIVTMRASQMYPDLFDDVVVIDSEVFSAEQLQAALSGVELTPQIPREHRVYPTPEEALQRYRLVPDHPTLPYIRAHVAERSLIATEGGWTWKFDRTFADHLIVPAPYPPASCRVRLLQAEHGRMTADMAAMILEGHGPDSHVTTIPDAGHHALLDQPLFLIDVLREFLAEPKGGVRRSDAAAGSSDR